MTKSKKQYASKQQQGSGDEFGRTIELAFAEHPWPASRSDLLEHAGRQGNFAKSDLARLKRIPHRDYHSIADLMDATRKADAAAVAQGPGPVTSADHNRRAMSGMGAMDSMGSEAAMQPPMRSTARYDEPTH